MKIQELLDPNYTPRVSVYMNTVKASDADEIASMLRGLMCAIEGWGSIGGLTNAKFSVSNPLILEFSSIENAHYFKSCVEYYFSDDILDRLRVSKRVRR